jgi:uncharacterized protein YjbI with pentapeptide repeats
MGDMRVTSTLACNRELRRILLLRTYELPGISLPRTWVNKAADLRHSSSVHPCLLHCEQRSLRQREAARLPYDSEHGMLWQDIKADVDKTRTRASKFAASAEWAFGKKTARVLAVVVLFAVVVALLFLFLDLYVGPTKPREKKDLVLAVAQILAGTALLSGLFFTWRTLQVNREGQITDRFTKAIDQLGKVDDKGKKLLEIRLGGIYALERISKDKEFEKDYYWLIMEVLTAYVRQHARRLPARRQEDAEGTAVGQKKGSREEPETSKVFRLDPDIQAIMTVIRQRARSFGQGEPEPLDLHATHLSEADLRGANLSAAYLWKVDLRDARLSKANLSGANLSEAYLFGASLSDANLTEAGLVGADLTIANLSKANLRKAILRSASLSDATLKDADLTEAELWRGRLQHADLRGANLSHADLKDADLSWAYLHGANLSHADLRGATFLQARVWEANLRGANLSKANLSEAYLLGADLREADLTEATLTQEQLEGTTGDENTQLPPSLEPPAQWGVKPDQQVEGD